MGARSVHIRGFFGEAITTGFLACAVCVCKLLGKVGSGEVYSRQTKMHIIQRQT